MNKLSDEQANEVQHLANALSNLMAEINAPVKEGVIALLSVAANASNRHGIPKELFVKLCGDFYDSYDLSYKMHENIINRIVN